jgi:hypothetical protein
MGIAVLGLTLGGCVSSTNPPVRRDDPPVRTRCVNDRDREPGTINRPLFYFLCIESP